ncbi:MAG: hypothetical protein ABSF44_03045 [Candidatus Bathyarchaeia archaeon]|jgi:TRAP-type C4-dicarboxylate transport system permease small subunit
MKTLLVGIGIVLIAVGLVFGYFSGAHMVHTVTTVNILSAIGSYFWDIIIAAVIVAIGGLMVIFGLKKA